MGESDKDETENYETIKIAVFAGSLANLNLLDFSKLNLKFLKITSVEFDVFIEETQYNHNEFDSHNKTIFDKFKVRNNYGEHLFALVPIDMHQPILEDNNWLVREVLLIMFPSDLAITFELDYQVIENKLWWCGSAEWDFHVTDFNDYYKNFLHFQDKRVDSINDFIKVYLERKKSIKYLKTVVTSYLHSFSSFQYPHLVLLSLCISLEATTTDSRNELTYRIRRNCAVICGDTEGVSERIFNSVHKLYSLRSSIVHGSDFQYKKVYQYISYARSLVSRLIIELVSLNITDLKMLNNQVSALGFGQRNSISNEYQEHIPNAAVSLDLLEQLK